MENGFAVARLGPTLLASLLLLACVTNGSSVVGTWSDLSGYRTWDWQPEHGARVEADQRDPGALDARLAGLVAGAIGRRGFERHAGRAELWVAYHLELRSHVGYVDEPRAPAFLASHHASASYWVAGWDRKQVRFETLHLVLGVVDGRGRDLWRASVVRRVEDGDAIDLDEAVEALLEHFPRHDRDSDESGRVLALR